MESVTGLNWRPITVPPGPVAAPLSVNVTVPGAMASNRIADSSPVPDAPVASPARAMVMSTRPALACCVNVAFAPPDRMKLPSWTLRTRSSAGSNVNVSEMVESLDTFEIEIGTVYGPAPTRNPVPGGVRMTCATPTPAVVTGGSAGDGGGTAAAVGGGAT